MRLNRSNLIWLFLYILFIIYASLFPLTDWHVPLQNVLDIWSNAADKRVSRSDLLVNLLAYIPFGFLAFSVLSGRYGNTLRTFLTILSGLLLSFLMEYLQLYLPARTSSLVDLLLNVSSTFFGAVIACSLGTGSTFGAILQKIRAKHFIDGKVADIGVGVIAIWCAAQLAPFAPSVDIASIKNGLKPLWLTLNDLSRLNEFRLAIYILNIFSLGAVLLLILRKQQDVIYWAGLFIGMVLVSKIFVGGRQLSLEALLGLLAGLFLLLMIRKLSKTIILFTGALAVVVAFIVDELRADYSPKAAYHDFNWIPFGSQMAESVSGVGSILQGMWPFATLGFFIVVLSQSGFSLNRLTATAMIAVIVFSLEYAQTGIVGRYADITTVVLSCLGYQLPWIAKND